MSYPVWHYDGTSAVRHEAELTPEGDGFRLAGTDADATHYPWASLTHLGASTGSASYGMKDRRGWRIIFAHGVPDALAPMLPRAQVYGGWIDRFGVWKAGAAFVAISAIALFIVVRIPDIVAPIVPPSWEKKLGDAMIGDMGGRFCKSKDGQAALDALAARIEGKHDDVTFHVANISMVNAVALPGGKIVIFRGLLQEAKSPDEVAGVLSHELGHVRNRHVMQALLRQAGLSVLLGGFDGNTSGYMSSLLSTTFTREAESQADGFAIKTLRETRIAPDDTANFFKRLSADEEKLGKASAALGYLSTHPLSVEREKAFRNSHAANIAYTPALDQKQWYALEGICHDDPNVEKDDGFSF